MMAPADAARSGQLLVAAAAIAWSTAGPVQRAVDATKQSLADGADSIRRQAQNVASNADDYVRESPWQAIGIAALVGAVVGILATRRN